MFIRFHVFGSNGWVEVRSDVHPGQKGITRLIISENTQPIRTREFDYKDTVRANLEAFAEAICNSMPYPITTEEKLGNILTMEAIIKSANSGKPISV